MPILLGEQDPDVYLLHQIYDPDIDGVDPSASGKIVPGIGSLVVDMTTTPSLTYNIWVVESVDDQPIPPATTPTYKSHLVPATSLIDNHLLGDKLMSYGNDVYMLFYDERTTPTKLMVGSNLMILGDNSAEYILYKHENDGTKTPISIARNAQGEITGNRVGIVAVQGNAIKRPNDCETAYTMTDNDLITMEVYDSAGVKNMDIILITKRATILNDLSAVDNVITDFDVIANQEKNTGEFVIFSGQNKDDLAVFPEITFSTGHKRVVPVNDASCFMYGWEDIKTDIVGMEYPLLFKYYLAPNVQSTISSGQGQVRWVDTTKKVVIEARSITREVSKISPIPYYDYSNNVWKLKFVAYYRERDNLADVTNELFWRDNTSFDGSSLGDWQDLRIGLHLQTTDGVEYDYEQNIQVLVDDINSTEPFKLRDNADSVLIFGAQDLDHNRPRLRYDSDSETYTISTAQFPTVAKFVENFFLNANPPWNEPEESISPEPTHFTIRNINESPIIPEPMEIEAYSTLTQLSVPEANLPPDIYMQQTLIFEFLEQINDTQFNVLYGTPVDVRQG